MKYIAFILLIFFSIPGFSQNCKTAYVHGNQVLDSLPIPPNVKKSLDSMRANINADFEVKKKQLQAVYKDAKTLKKKIKAEKKKGQDSLSKFKYKMLNKVYGAKIREACMKIYDNGKKYESVFNADNRFFSKIPENSCDVTKECLRIVKAGK